jgi:hypothetical protein
MDNRLRKLTLRRVDEADPAPAKPPARELGHVFIVTYGRSGSTLLLGVLNSLPGYLIRGENRDALYHLYMFHSVCAADRAKQRTGSHPDDTRNPFFGIRNFPGNKSIAGIRRLVTETLLRPQADTRVTGFKEIRWYQPDLPEYVAFLQRVFPGARFIVNTRNHAEVAKSKWWADHEDAHGTLAALEASLLELAASLGDAAYHVHYDDYVADPSVLRGLIGWLGEEYDEARVAEVMGVPHSAW